MSADPNELRICYACIRANRDPNADQAFHAARQVVMATEHHAEEDALRRLLGQAVENALRHGVSIDCGNESCDADSGHYWSDLKKVADGHWPAKGAYQ